MVASAWIFLGMSIFTCLNITPAAAHKARCVERKRPQSKVQRGSQIAKHRDTQIDIDAQFLFSLWSSKYAVL